MYHTLPSRSGCSGSPTPVFQVPEKQEQEPTGYDDKKTSFIMSTLNKNLELYKLMHNELSDLNSKIEQLVKTTNDIFDNLIDVNVQLNQIEEKVIDSQKKKDEPIEERGAPLKKKLTAPRSTSISRR